MVSTRLMHPGAMIIKPMVTIIAADDLPVVLLFIVTFRIKIKTFGQRRYERH
jgi:hypothetical protein